MRNYFADTSTNMRLIFARRRLAVPLLCFLMLYMLIVTWLVRIGTQGDRSGEFKENLMSSKKKPSTYSHTIMMGKLNSKHLPKNSQPTYSARNSNKAFFTKMPQNSVYILGAVAGNTTSNASWDMYKVYATVNMTGYASGDISCCLMYKRNGKANFVKQVPLRLNLQEAKCFLMPVYLECSNNRHNLNERPVGIGITLDSPTCKGDNINYITPYYPLKQSGTTLAIGTKVAYEDVSAEQIIEWMETYRYLGVDKVVTYYIDTVNEDALKVLKYYESTGLLDLYHHKMAAADLYQRDSKTTKAQWWCDLLMTVFDSYQKMFGYTYFGIIDHDEFLIPSKNRSIKQMLADLYATYAAAAGFKFKTQFYHTSWGPSGEINDLILGRYINTTDSGPQDDHSKYLYKPTSVLYGRVTTLNTRPAIGKIMYTAPPEQGFIRHYRECREQTRSKCQFETKRVTDTSMAEWSMRILDNVHNARKEIFGQIDIKDALLLKRITPDS